MRPMSRLLILAAAVLALAGCGEKSVGGAAVAAGAHTLGKADAPVKVIEYASLSCSHCMDFNNKEFPALKARYIDTGKVHYELREMLNADPNISAAAFLVAACTGEAKYFDTVDKVFQALPAIYQDPRGGLLSVARAQGLSEAAYEKCVSDEAALKALSTRVEANNKEAPGGTPTFRINGVEYKGEKTADALGRAIDAAAAK